ncbi:dedicator of cytokinesis protein 7-like [Hetaerina americana]|uniref:dedicator of cytokinesis protein 7-like n=1 Tax=Hetaerina americana TaxID=62018 RepID=UPI003A7F25FA
MPSNCGKCGHIVKRVKGNVACGDSREQYHLACSSKTEEDLRTLSDTTPIKSNGSLAGEEPAAATLTKILTRIKCLQDEQGEIKKSRLWSHETINELTKSISNVNSAIVSLGEKLEKTIGDLCQLQKRVSEQEQYTHQLEQETKRNVVEIQGVPIKEGEILSAIIHQIYLVIGVQVDTSDIDYVHRVKTRSDSERPPIIMLRFLRGETKSHIVGVENLKTWQGGGAEKREFECDLPPQIKELIHYYTSDYVVVKCNVKSRGSQLSGKEDAEEMDVKHEYEIDIPEDGWKSEGSMETWSLKQSNGLCLFGDFFEVSMEKDGIEMLPNYDRNSTDSSTLSQSGIFHISHLTSGLYIVIRLEKVLQGDIDKSVKPYVKHYKNSEKLREKTAQYIWRLGRYRMPFAWAAISVKELIERNKTNETLVRRKTLATKTTSGGLAESWKQTNAFGARSNSPWTADLNNFIPVSVKLPYFLKQDMDSLSDDALLGLIRQMHLKRKSEIIPGCLHLRISPCPIELAGCLSPEMVPINPIKGDNYTPIREMLEFPPQDNFEPFNTYRNLLYVYPRSFSPVSKQVPFRNITVRVELREVGQTSSVSAIYGKSSGPKLISAVYTSVSYHKSRKSESAVESSFGFSWLPLFMNANLRTGEFQLPVMKVDPLLIKFSEIAEFNNPLVKGFNTHEGLFTVSLKAVSSVYPETAQVQVGDEESGLEVYGRRMGMHLIVSTAHFLSDLLRVIDRGWVLLMIENFYSKIPADLQMYKLDFLYVICQHEQFIPLNFFGSLASNEGFLNDKENIYSKVSMTLGSRPNFETLFELSLTFKKNYFLAGLLINCFQNYLSMEIAPFHEKAIKGLTSLLSRFDRDRHFQSPKEKLILAALFTPIVGITMRNLPRLKLAKTKSFEETIKKSMSSSEVVPEVNTINVSKSSFFFPVDCERYSRGEESISYFSAEETHSLLLCFLWVLKNVDKEMLKSSLHEISPNQFSHLLEVLVICLTYFEYRSNRALYNKVHSISLCNISTLESPFQHNKEISKGYLSSSIGDTLCKKEMEFLKERDADVNRYGDLAAEVSLIVLDCLELFAEALRGTENEHRSMQMLIGTLLAALSKTQSFSVLGCIFSTQRSLVEKFPLLFFDDESELCKDLCLQLLLHCSSVVSKIRTQASLSLYLLIRQSFQMGQIFTWVKLQLTVAVSTLVANFKEIREDSIHKSLKNIIKYAEADSRYADTLLPDQMIMDALSFFQAVWFSGYLIVLGNHMYHREPGKNWLPYPGVLIPLVV